MPSIINGRFTDVPPIIAADYETALTNGRPSTQFYNPDFRVISAAFSWPTDTGELASLFVEGEEEVGKILAQLVNSTIIVHNLQFEYSVTLFRYPEICAKIPMENWIDTMRLVQVYDNGGTDYDQPMIYADPELAQMDATSGNSNKPKARPKWTGLGLVAAIHRILPPQYHDHKREAYDWLQARGVKKGKEGSNLHLLPHDIFARYNIADSENTYRLYQAITSYFEGIKYDWTFDHRLHRGSVQRLVNAEAVGIRVDRKLLAANRLKVIAEIADIESSFRSSFLAPIERLEWQQWAAKVDKLKTAKGKVACWKRLSADWPRFNIGSNKQLAELFMGELGIQPRHFTDKGAPSFKSAFLDQWGPGGKMLFTRRKRLIVLKQMEALLALSERDGRWHSQLRACGTKTSRYTGKNA